MISGDNKYTAIECAKRAGILKEGEEKTELVAMDGEDFMKEIGGITKHVDQHTGKEIFKVGSKNAFKKTMFHLKVLARTNPDHKLALVAGLKEMGECVAMTAEGINDATALKQANVGICMGVSGTEVAKDASDIIILDDNFISVFRSVQYGRNIYDNIRKFFQFQMVVNVVCVFIVLISGITLGESPFNVIQLLWINLIMDTLGAIALSTERPHPTELK